MKCALRGVIDDNRKIYGNGNDDATRWDMDVKMEKMRNVRGGEIVWTTNFRDMKDPRLTREENHVL